MRGVLAEACHINWLVLQRAIVNVAFRCLVSWHGLIRLVWLDNLTDFDEFGKRREQDTCHVGVIPGVVALLRLLVSQKLTVLMTRVKCELQIV